MKTRFVPLLLIAAALFSAAVLRAAEARKPDDRPKLALIISENIQSAGGAVDDVVRLDIAFEKVATQRKWPVKLVIERYASGVPSYDTELYIYSQPVRREVGIELVYRAWTYLVVKGRKTDFKIVEYRMTPRLGENPSDTYDKLFLGYANKVADLIEPILFPKPDKAADKPKS
jgi:hypothetical protein